MDHGLRNMLIGAAKKGKPISYGSVMRLFRLNANSIEDRNRLSKELADISRYEHKNKRPLLSAMAMYEGFTDFGKGIYKLAEELCYGKATDLEKEMFAFKEQKNCIDFWKNTNVFEELNEAQVLEFFSKDDLDLFFKWQGQVYNRNNSDHVIAGQELKNSVWAKTAYWAGEIQKKLTGFEIIKHKMFLQPGSEDGKTVSRFKPYSWARIFRTEYLNSDIFFTVGIDAPRKVLVYKLDYFFEAASKLNTAQKNLCEQLISKNFKWQEISYESVAKYTWPRLLNESLAFIQMNIEAYDKIVHSVWENIVPLEFVVNDIILRDKPITNITSLPVLNPSFSGIDDKDYLAELEQSIHLGLKGEELVLRQQIKLLNNLGKPELAKKVAKVKDGCGYDIISYDSQGKELHIEVKTTTLDINTTFNLSLNEYLFMHKFPENYHIYRLFNYKAEVNGAEFYIIEKPTHQLLFQPTIYRAYLMS